MLGAIIGDTIGSVYEWNNYKGKDFPLYSSKCFLTDDSIMTLAIAKALLESGKDLKKLSLNAIHEMQTLGRKYPGRGYGGNFLEWLYLDHPEPYYSCGNGSAMRISPVGFVASSIEEAKALSKAVTEVTHNHPEGLKGAESMAVAIVLARQGKKIPEIKDYIEKHYYNIDFTLDRLRPTYEYDVTCQGSVPQSLEAFFESTSFEDAIRNAISLGGDSDTLAAITGGLAEAYYGIPQEIRKKQLTYMDSFEIDILNEFEKKYPSDPKN